MGSKDAHGFFWMPVGRTALDTLRSLGWCSDGAALLALAQAIASSPGWPGHGQAVLVARPKPAPVLALLGRLDAPGVLWREQGCGALNHLRYVDYAQAETDCQRLAARLVERLGADAIAGCHFVGIPRGGLIVLGMLSYALGLTRAQLEPPQSPEVPLVVVDDCALTGRRFAQFLERCESRQVLFAPLYPHPRRRAAIAAEAPGGLVCLRAHDLHDRAPETFGDEYAAWQQRWAERTGDRRYWFGQTEHVCFAWSEPDRLVWNPVAERVEVGWRVVPPELCLKNRPAPGEEPVPVQVQPEGEGPLRPAETVVFGQFEGQTIVANTAGGESVALEGVAADVWHAVVAHGGRDAVVAALLEEYEVEEPVLRKDVCRLIEELVTRGMLYDEGGRDA